MEPNFNQHAHRRKDNANEEDAAARQLGDLRRNGIPSQIRTGFDTMVGQESRANASVDPESRMGMMIKALLLVYMRQAVRDAAIYAHVARREVVTTRDIVIAMRNLALPRSNFWQTDGLDQLVTDAMAEWHETRALSDAEDTDTVYSDNNSMGSEQNHNLDMDVLEGQCEVDEMAEMAEMAEMDNAGGASDTNADAIGDSAEHIMNRIGVVTTPASSDEQVEWTMATSACNGYQEHASLIDAMNSAEQEWAQWTPSNELDQLIASGIDQMEARRDMSTNHK